MGTCLGEKSETYTNVLLHNGANWGVWNRLESSVFRERGWMFIAHPHLTAKETLGRMRRD